MQPPTPGSESPSNYPRPNLDIDRESLREVAAAQKQVMYAVLIWIAIALGNGAVQASHVLGLSIVVLLLVFFVWIFAVVSAVRMAKALHDSPIIYGILMVVPCVNIIMLLVLSGKATTQLKAAGIKVGLMGADPKSI